ncbi:type I restriction enzyme endonuclease domain-containing protein [Neobacillus terrae]|uniref:type I restriction enzyme endonuclease domain-containing protein n=1 Tax=Neobacillus terrae TaxID=3034837 RepID=UPI001A9C82BD|nr:type I restriction enzyme endonuclease domain-containing protein [Neobacillus terrae]
MEPEDKRAEFELSYKQFAGTMEQLMPGHVSTDNTNDLRWLSYIRAAAKARFEPDTELDISDCGEKVRQIINDHLTSYGVEQWIKPITLFDKDYKKKLETLKSDEAIASSMEHAAKHVINVKMSDNPVYYTSLLEKLQQILDETKNDWTERKKQLEEFINNDVKMGETEEAEALGLTNKEYAFFEIIKKHLLEPDEAAGSKAKEASEVYISQDILDLSKDIAQNVADIVANTWVIDWTTNPTKTADIERSIFMMLTSKYFKQIKMDVRKQLITPLLHLAKKHFATRD